MTAVDKVIAAVRRHGSDAADLRDAAHEACHALELDLRGKWTRDRIHAKVVQHGRRDPFGGIAIVESEIKARAVERIVCTRLGVAIDPSEEWAHVAIVEMATTFGGAPPIDLFLARIAKRLTSPQMIALAERVITLGAA